MANDTVEAARQAVIERLCDCDPTTKFNHDTAQCMDEGVRRLDALIAAVRAERDTPTRCRHCGNACQVDECLDCWRQRHAS
jgi:hypothetical protein